MSPAVSIIVPCYNCEKYVERCIESIFKQSYADIEVIAVNDGSSDNSLNLLIEKSKTDKRLSVINKANGGVSSARNTGLQHARGEWILFVDIDDKISSDCIESMLSLTEDKTDIVIAGYLLNGNIASHGIERTIFLNAHELAKQLFKPTDFPYLGYPWAKLFRRDVITKYDICFNETIKYNEDRLFVLKYLTHIKSGAYTTLPVYDYIQTSLGAMGSIEGPGYWKFETDLDAFVEMNEIVRSFNSPELTDLVRQSTISSYRWNKRLNMQYGNNNADTNRRLRKKLMMALPKSYLLRLKLAEFKGFVYNCLRKFIK